MLKFVSEPKDGKPAFLGLGLSFENLRRLPGAAIQFHAATVGLGAGIFVIAHAGDPELDWYRSQIGTQTCEVLVLTDEQLHTMATRGEVLKVPIRPRLDGHPCEALIFVGETEQVLHEAFKRRGLVNEDNLQGPTEVVRVLRVDFVNRLKLAAGGVGFLVATALVMSQSHHQDIDLFVDALMLGTALVFFALLYLRWGERIELDCDGMRRIHRLSGFTLPWSELASAATRSDSLGPFQLELVRRDGRRHKLSRIYEDWGRLVEEVRAHL